MAGPAAGGRGCTVDCREATTTEELHARRQEMKWVGGCLFVKKVDLSSTQGASCTGLS